LSGLPGIEKGISRDVSSLFTGDFFDEMALLHGERRTATVWAAAPCYLYELRRDALEETMKKYPHIRNALEEIDRKRKGELNGGGNKKFTPGAKNQCIITYEKTYPSFFRIGVGFRLQTVPFH